MNLGILLSLGDSLENQERSGQFERFSKFYLSRYKNKFENIFVFSYGSDKNFQNSQDFILIPNRFGLNRFFYALLLPFLERETVKKASLFRVMQTTGAIPAILAKIFYKNPFLVTYGFKYHEFAKIEGKFLTAFFLKFLEKIILKFADGIIVTTKALKTYVNNFAQEEKIHLIPNGVDVNLFKPFNKKFNSKNIQILSVGRIEKQKNYENLIEAIALLDHKKYITLTIIGRGSLQKRLENLAKKLSVKLKIIDFAPHDQMPNFYASADIFILPSLIEGHPKALLEAMASGLPCIASKVPGNAEIIRDGKTGVFSTTESGDIKNKIDFLVQNDDLREKLGENARRFITENYNIEKLVTKEVEILKSFSSKA